MRNLLKDHTARIVNLVMLVLVIWTIFNLKYYNTVDRVVEADVKSYYAYLPAKFIHDDMSLKFMDADWAHHHRNFWPLINDDGEYVIKTSMGMSYMYAPFFFIGHAHAAAVGAEQDGFSWPYKMWLSLSSVFFLAIGMFYMRKTLLRHFSENVTMLTCVAILFGTNMLFYATVQMAYSHVYSFALIAMFMYFLDPWLERQQWKHTILLGVLVGLITLIRPPNGLIVVFFLLYKITSFSDFKERFLLILKNIVPVLVMIVIAGSVWIPQFFYWHAVTGDWLYFSYGNERFFFNNPQFFRGLFSYQKGWLLYTPMMVFALLGIIMTWRSKPEWRLGLTIFTFINMYIIFSWWCWWYGGSYGQRPFIDTYAVLALPLALFLAWVVKQKAWFKAVYFTVFTFFIVISVFKARQVYGGSSVHHDAMTKEAYWATFLTLKTPENFEELLRHPDYDAAVEGRIEYLDKPHVKTD